MTGEQVLEPSARPSSWRSLLGEAIRGSAHDYTGGPIGRALLLLAVPMVLETAMESVFALTDIFWVSRLGAEAIAAVGLTESMMTLVYTAAIGLGIGVSAMVARRIGEKDPTAAATAAVQGIAIGLLVAAGVAVAGISFAPGLLRVMGASPALALHGAGYTRMMLGGSASVLLLFLINAIFRGAGDPAIAMRTLWLGNGINLVLDPCLIFGLGPFPAMGVTGAAVATTIGRGIAVLYQVHRLRQPGGRLWIGRSDLRLRPAIMRRVLRLSGTGTFQVLVATSSYIALVRILSSFGDAAVAGYTVAIRLAIFAMLPSWGLSNAAATMVGQALGAGKPERARKAVWRAAQVNVAFLGTIGLLFLVCAVPLVHVFTSDPAASPLAISALRTLSAGFGLYALGMVLTGAFNGAGDPWTPTWLNLGCFWLLEIPLAWTLARAFGPFGVFVSVPLAEAALAGAAAVMFRRGKWAASLV